MKNDQNKVRVFRSATPAMARRAFLLMSRASPIGKVNKTRVEQEKGRRSAGQKIQQVDCDDI